MAAWPVMTVFKADLGPPREEVRPLEEGPDSESNHPHATADNDSTGSGDRDQSDPPQGQPTTDGEGVELTLDEVLGTLGWADGEEFTADLTAERDHPGQETGAPTQPESRAKSNHTPPRYTFAELLAVLGHVDDYRNEQVSVCWRHRGGTFTPELKSPGDAPGFVDYLVGCADNAVDVWFGVNPINSSVTNGRGEAKDVTRLVALYADLDVKPGGCPDLDTARGVIDDVAAVMGERPCAVTWSGHGLQPLWAVDPESGERLNNPEAQKLLRRFGRLVKAVAAKRGCAVDSVFDLPRVLRVPDTVNVKNPEHPVPTWCEADTGQPLTVEQILTALDDYGVTEIASDAAFTGEVISPPDGWECGSIDCSYVLNMVVPWDQESDEPTGGRHQWAMNRAVRLAAAHRLGCITEEGLTASLEHLETSLAHWCQIVGEPRDLHYDEVSSAYRWAMDKVGTFTDEQARQELGNHHHDGAGGGVTLPKSFWKRPTLDRIRQAAWSMLSSPDAVLGITLAKLSASLPPVVRVDTGVRRPMSLNTFVAPVGQTGGFKSSAMQTAKSAVKLVPDWSSDDNVGVLRPLGENLPHRVYLGSGQGIVESFMGEVETPPAEGSRGKPKSVRRQVRTNVVLSVDEGNGLAKALGDTNSIVGETLRELWTGTDTGQGNARTENRRGVREGEYSFGMIVGFQLSVLGKFLGSEDAELGTPQRFLFVWTGAPDIPDGGVSYPGDLVVKIPGKPMTLCPQLRDRVRAELVPQLRNGGTEDESDSQRISMLIRLAGLLALLDGEIEGPSGGLVMTVHGRDTVTEADWALAETMLNTSRAIRTHAIAERRRKATSAKRAERASNLAAEVEAEDAKGTIEGRMQLRILGFLSDVGGRAKWSGDGGLYKRFNGEDLQLAKSVRDRLEADGKIKTTKQGRSEYVEMVL
jgi:hypothetical protein